MSHLRAAGITLVSFARRRVRIASRAGQARLCGGDLDLEGRFHPTTSLQVSDGDTHFGQNGLRMVKRHMSADVRAGAMPRLDYN